MRRYITENAEYIQKTTGLKEPIGVYSASTGGSEAEAAGAAGCRVDLTTPGLPAIWYHTEEAAPAAIDSEMNGLSV